MKILTIEDDSETAKFIADSFREHGHTVDVVSDGREGLFLAAGETYDLIIVDRRLPGLDGLSLIQTARGAKVTTPIIIVTTMGCVAERVEGLNAGADDYLAKPFAFEELFARANALARRPPLSSFQTTLRVGDLEMDLVARTVTRGGKSITLQPQEFKLLEYLMRHPGRIVTRTMLLEGVWDFHFDPQTNIVETNISRLRAKIDRGFDKEMIRTVRGAGYSLHEPH